mmetsp:Transcript_6237/g.7440  ORF Transcript_6237/g.7440 Transcript_6237/m.7440 type:complete len:128 (-) Transcript_6237:2240-2623(-)
MEFSYRRQLQIFESTFKRNICIEKQEVREILAYGAENPIINQEKFEKVGRPDSLFKKKVLQLESVQCMNVWAAAECIPSSYGEVDVALYHVYHDEFDLIDARIVIKVAPQSKGEGLREDQCWTVVYD